MILMRRWVLPLVVALSVLAGAFAGRAATAPAAPAEAAAQALTDETADWLAATLAAPVPHQTLHEMVPQPTMPAIAYSLPLPGGGRRLGAMRSLIVRWGRIDRGDPLTTPSAGHVLLHELLHLHRARHLEEGIVDAVALDLVAPWSQRFLGTTLFLQGYGSTASDGAYPEGVRLVRALSAAATGGSWRTYRARMWRRALLLAADVGRRAMVAEANARASR